jgi:hypothetical protein
MYMRCIENEMWRLDGGWKANGKINGRFCEIILGVPRFAANNMAELELEKNNRKGKFVSMIAKYWLRLLHLISVEILRMCHEWHIYIT